MLFGEGDGRAVISLAPRRRGRAVIALAGELPIRRASATVGGDRDRPSARHASTR